MFPTALVRPLWPATLRSLRLLTRLAVAALVLAFGLGAGQPALAGPSSAPPPAHQAADLRTTTPAGAVAPEMDAAQAGMATAAHPGPAAAGDAVAGLPASRPVADLLVAPATVTHRSTVAESPAGAPAQGATGLRGPPLS